MQQDRVHVRLLIVAGVALLWGAGVFGRLAYLQLFRHSEYLARAQRQQQRTIEITPKRGAIYDRNMHPLAMSVPVDSAFAVPSEIADEGLAARLLSRIVNKPEDVLEARLQSSRTFVWIARKLPPEKVAAIKALNLKGIEFVKENQRFYPKRELAAHVLGFVDPDEKGLGGIEYELDKQIRGESEKMVMLADARQRRFDGGAPEPQPGASVVLTLDEKIQYIAGRELDAAVEKTHALAGTVMVMNPNNGEILALANWPHFNPNAASTASQESRKDRAVETLYEPGSTFKLITLAAAFDQNATNPDEIFDCENGAITIAGRRIHDHKPFGLLKVSEILAKSSDVGAIKVALRVGAPKFYDYIHAFGFGSLTGVDLPGETKGIARPVERWTPVSIGSISMGQEVGVTPIQLLTAVSAIANGGTLYRPHVVRELRRGNTVLPAPGSSATEEPRQVIRPETAATLRRLMEGVVLNGTGTLARLDGWTAAGKTGSAQKIDPSTGRYSRTQLIASFSGLAPINNPAITILVSLDSPVGQREGGQVAAPVFKRVAEQVLAYLDVPRDAPLNPKLIQAQNKERESSEVATLEDAAPLDFSGKADEAAEQSQAALAAAALATVRAPESTVDEGGDIVVPDFLGKTMREVTEVCLRMGLEPVVVGSSLATQQTPVAGAKVKRGAKITVEFGMVAPVRAGKLRAALRN
ncbi:MAG TPA: penicillin-binding protein [Candidatus Acidoferrum sp.]|jgi:cell division protein FtsI (penicillin-binding protein 3)